MIIISGSAFDISGIINEYPGNSIESQLLHKVSSNSEIYQYDNLNQLKFELKYRKEIIASAMELYNSNLSFSDFRDSKCNSKYWKRTESGGFSLKGGIKPSEAINDIFINGDKYATECATAIMIIYYKGLLNIYEEELFNKIFTKIYLMDWDVNEPLLKDVTGMKNTEDILLGDRGYFPNPDFDPSTPEWQGENVIVLPDSMYYGHGIGIATADTIIQTLNSKRKEGATRSAYLLNSAGRPDFKKLSDVYHNPVRHNTQLVWKPFPPPITSV